MNSLGYIPDEPDNGKDRLMAAAKVVYRGGSVRDNIKEVLDQGPTNSCVAQALASCLAILGVARGGLWGLISRLWLYYYARLALGPFGRDIDGKLADDGCRPRDALRVLSKMGCPDESKYGFKIAKVNKRPSFLLRVFAIDRIFAYRRCLSIGDIQNALAQGFPVIIGLDIDAAFMDADGPGLITHFDDTRIGGHMLTIVADYEESDSAGILNSWGTAWREGGEVKMTWSLIAKELKTTDAWAILK